MQYSKINIYDYFSKELICVTDDAVIRDDTLIVKTKHTKPFRKWQKLRVDLLGDNGVVELEAFTRMIVDDVQVNIVIASQSDLTERRQYIKVPCNVQTEIQSRIENGKYDILDFPIPMIIRNISIGGMLFSSPVLLEKGMQGRFPFYEGHKPIELIFEIVRVEDFTVNSMGRPEDEENLYRYGCKFAPMDDNIESILWAYILRLDLIYRKEKKEKEEKRNVRK